MSSSDAVNPIGSEAPIPLLDEQDLGPLAWVLDELRKSLDGAVKALHRFVHEAQAAREDDLASLDTGSLRIARQQLHQAAGALEMVAMARPALLLRAMETAVQRLMQRPQLANDHAMQVFKRASFALVEYLESVLAGKQVSPVVLFPQYRDAQTLAGAERIHPSDLWPLKRHLHEPDLTLTRPALYYGNEARTRLDGDVLRIVKSGDAAAAAHLQDTCLGFAAAQPRGQARAFWKICAGFFEALAHGLIQPDIYVKRVTSRVLMQYASLSKGDTALVDHLLQDLLFFCAQANIESAAGQTARLPALQAVRKTFGLTQHAFIDYETPRFGQFDPSVLSQARKRIAAAAETWSAVAGGDRLKLKLAADQFAQVCESLRTLHTGSEPLAQALTRTMAGCLRADQPPAATLAMEVATAVLYLQASFEELDAAREHMTERAQRLAQRLDSVAAGNESQPLELWMEELYRRVSDHRTMGNVVDELRATLAESEKLLDQFFRQPALLEVLKPVPSCLQQMRGVLQVLELESAAQAVFHMREIVEHLLLGEVSEEQRAVVFDRLGSNLGALGFLIDMLAYQRTMARKLFVYDEELGELKLLTGRVATVPVADSVEQTPFAFATSEPTDLDEVNDGADVEAVSHFPPTQQPEALPTETITPVASAVEQPVPDGVDDADDELLDIFLEEAREVVESGLTAIVALQEMPADMGEQTTLRRAFHTLKGSSRMVGLNDFGEAAWAMEQTLNAWLAEQKPIQAPLLQLSEQALQAFGRWADAIAADTAQHWRVEPFQMAAEAMRVNGTLLSLELPEETEAVAQPILPEVETVENIEVVESLEVGEVPVDVQEVEAVEIEESETETEVWLKAQEIEAVDNVTVATEDIEVANNVANIAEIPEALEVEAIEATDDIGEDTPDIVEVTETPEAEQVTKAEALVDAVEMVEGEGIEAPSAATSPEIAEISVPAVALLPEIQPAIDGFPDTLIIHPSEDSVALPEEVVVAALPDTPLVQGIDFTNIAVHTSAEQSPPADQDKSASIAPELAVPDTDEATKVIGDLHIDRPLYNVYIDEADKHADQLRTTLQEWTQELYRPLPDTAVAQAHSLAGDSATVGFATLSQLARTLEHALGHVQLQPSVFDLPACAQCFNAAAAEICRLLQSFRAGTLELPDAQVLASLQRILETEIPAQEIEIEEDLADGETQGDEWPAVVVHTAPSSTAKSEPAIATDPSVDAMDAIDPDLFPIFEEEALELLPVLGATLRQWVTHPQDADARNRVLRSLHTLKGSARLAGAMGLGERAHRMESAVEQIEMQALTAQAIDPLLTDFDSLQARFEALRMQGEESLTPMEDVPVEAVAPVVPPSATHIAETQPEPTIGVPPPAETEVPPEVVETAAPLPLTQPAVPLARPVVNAPQRAVSTREGQTVRVRAQLLDHLLSQTGEVMIARTRLNTRMTQFRSALADMSNNLDRLRIQLRDIEVQAESQMQSRMALSKEVAAGFDPLEFDRFTRVQELTRMLAESVNDVATVQRTMQRALEGAEDDLVAQGRQTRELQRDLLRTRMVEFDSISERLYAVVRLACRESGKQAKLDISGGTIEMDRGVLERMTPAFEHLLRNCAGHGIETPEERMAAGKDMTGTITITLRQEGNDISVEFRDDGAGLNLAGIRAKAIAQGLIDADAVVTEADAARLIFMPGFSTASQVTGLSGRGVGMDVVRTEINALGGRIETTTVIGQGSSFRMVLPLTTAVTQILMLRAGQFTFGVPASLVETVRRTTTLEELQAAYSSHNFQDGEEDIPFCWAGALLQNAPRSHDIESKTYPVVLLHSASQRMALHVDETLGNQEVVVKNLGPQLARLPGLAGMSVLPSGAVVLIYNPVALTTVYGEKIRQMMRPPADINTVVMEDTGIRSLAPLVLVVDDSITVRRVTQRLLLREGYRVALANDGLQALERLQEERPMVVLSDIEMPRMDGFDLARNIRSDAALRDLPIIMITSRIAQKHRDHAMELGVNHYLGKPYSEEELLSLVQQYTHAAKAEEEAESAV